MMIKHILLWTLIAVTTLGTGCLMGSNVSVKNSGTKVSTETLKQIENGKTSREWLVAIAGNPTNTRRVDENTEILEYAWSRKVEKSSGIIFVMHRNHKEESSGRAFIEVKNDIVQKWWQETD